MQARLTELEARIEALAAENEQRDMGDLMPLMGESFSGLGPAASKVYLTSQGLSLAGYGELLYTGFAGSGDQADALRGVMYMGYRFNEEWVFNSEIEFEHAGTGGGGSASLEFAYLDHLSTDGNINQRMGLLLVPMGFVNEMHEPPTFLGATRPVTENRIIPSTWRENGVGLFGDFGESDAFSWRTYLVNGLDANGFSEGGVRGGRQKGSRAEADDLALVGRLDWNGRPGLIIGGSFYTGDSGQNDPTIGDAGTTITEVHAEWKRGAWWLRGLYAQAEIDDADVLSTGLGLTVAEKMVGSYVEVGYDLMAKIAPESEKSVVPFIRWECIDTQDEVAAGFTADASQEDEILTFGIHYRPIDNIVFKIDYQDWDEDTDRVEIALGYSF